MIPLVRWAMVVVELVGVEEAEVLVPPGQSGDVGCAALLIPSRKFLVVGIGSSLWQGVQELATLKELCPVPLGHLYGQIEGDLDRLATWPLPIQGPFRELW